MIDLLLVGPAEPGVPGTAAGQRCTELRITLAAQRVPVGSVDPVDDLTVLAGRLAGARTAVGLVAANLVAHPSLLADTLDDSRSPVCALVVGGRCAVLRLTPEAAHATAGLLRPGSAGDDLDAVLQASALAGIPVARLDPGLLVAVLAGPEQPRAAALRLRESQDERALRLRSVARSGDGFYSSVVVRRLSRPLTGLAVRAGLRPNPVTLLSLGIGLAAAALLAGPEPLPRLLGAVLLQVSLVVDCVDGEVARYTRTFSGFGAWLDGVGDRVKEYAVLAALAVAAGRTGRDLWPVAALGLAVASYRHLVDHRFHRQEAAVTGSPAPGLAPAVEHRPETASVWLRRVLQFPIGERWLLLSVLAAVAGPRTALVGFLLAGLASALWTTFGRVLRSVPRLGWLLPGLRWWLEVAVVLAAFAWRGGDQVWLGYLLLAVVAYHLYDVIYREKYRAPSPLPAVSRALLGAEGRALVVALAALAGGRSLVVATAVLTAWLVVVVVVESLLAWRAVWAAAATAGEAPSARVAG